MCGVDWCMITSVDHFFPPQTIARQFFSGYGTPVYVSTNWHWTWNWNANYLPTGWYPIAFQYRSSQTVGWEEVDWLYGLVEVLISLLCTSFFGATLRMWFNAEKIHNFKENNNYYSRHVRWIWTEIWILFWSFRDGGESFLTFQNKIQH